jgi:hypothetical protein
MCYNIKHKLSVIFFLITLFRSTRSTYLFGVNSFPVYQRVCGGTEMFICHVSTQYLDIFFQVLKQKLCHCQSHVRGHNGSLWKRVVMYNCTKNVRNHFIQFNTKSHCNGLIQYYKTIPKIKMSQQAVTHIWQVQHPGEYRLFPHCTFSQSEC